MTKVSGWIPFLLMLAVILVVVAAGCTSPSAQPAPGITSSPAAGGGQTVMIQNFAFSPATLTVKAGTTVTWTNNDGTQHTVTPDAGAPAGFGSGGLSPGTSYSFTFTSPGTYPYHCSIHTSMKGTVIVT